MNIAIAGLGYVGFSNAVFLAKAKQHALLKKHGYNVSVSVE
jgi:UDP-glucose 6-dehydrogenase